MQYIFEIFLHFCKREAWYWGNDPSSRECRVSSSSERCTRQLVILRRAFLVRRTSAFRRGHVGYRRNAEVLRFTHDDNVRVQSEFHFPGLCYQILAAPALVLFFSDLLEAGVFVDAAGGEQLALGPQKDFLVSRLTGEADAFLH